MRIDLQKSILGVTNNYISYKKPSWMDSLSWTQKFSHLNSLSNSIVKYESAISRLGGLNTLSGISSAIENNIQRQLGISSILGTHDFANRHSKMFYSGIADRLQTDMSRHIGLSAIAGKFSTLSVRDFTNSIAQSAQLGRIFSTQDHLTTQFSGIAGVAMSRSVINQLFSASTMYNRVSASVALNAAAVHAEDTLDIVEEIANRVNEATTEIYEKGYFTADDLIEIKDNILDYLRSRTKEDWQWFIGIVLTIFLGLLPYFISANTSTVAQPANVATHEDIRNFREEIIAFYKEETSQNGINKKLAADVVLRVKPDKKSSVIKTIEKGTVVTVLNVAADWAYVSYIDSIDGMPACGWISTRFFCKQVFSKSFKERVKNNKGK